MIAAVSFTVHVSPCLPTSSTALTFVIVVFNVASMPVFSRFYRYIITIIVVSLPWFPSHYHVSPVLQLVNQQLVHVLSIFYPNCDILSGFLSLLLQLLTPSIPFVCLHYYYRHRRGRSLHPCLHCFRRCIAVCIIVVMLSVRFF